MCIQQHFSRVKNAFYFMAKLIDDLRNIAIYVQQNAVSVQCSVLPFRCVVNDCIILGMRYSPRCNDLHETSSSSHLNMRMNFTSRKISTAHYMIRLRIIAFAFENKTGSSEAISIYFASPALGKVPKRNFYHYIV